MLTGPLDALEQDRNLIPWYPAGIAISNAGLLLASLYVPLVEIVVVFQAKLSMANISATTLLSMEGSLTLCPSVRPYLSGLFFRSSNLSNHMSAPFPVPTPMLRLTFLPPSRPSYGPEPDRHRRSCQMLLRPCFLAYLRRQPERSSHGRYTLGSSDGASIKSVLHDEHGSMLD